MSRLADHPLEAAGALASTEVVPRNRFSVLGDRLSSALMWVAATLVVVSVAFVAIRVFWRYVLNHDLTFGDDILTLLFAWMIFLGIPRAIWRDTSPRLGAAHLLERRPALHHFQTDAQMGATATFFAYTVISGITLWPIASSAHIASLGLPQSVLESAVIVGGVLAVVVCLLKAAARGFGSAHLAGYVLGLILVAGLLVLPLPSGVAALIAIVVLLALDAPIAVALGAAGSAMVAGGQPDQLSTPAAQLLEGPGNLALLAIPLFMLMGGLVARSRLADDLTRFIRALVGWIPGGVGVASIGTAAVFANMSGSAVADSAAIATVFLPQMTAAGFEVEEAAALQASAGVLGVIFPPAIAMILFGTIANLNLVSLFKAVIVPGLLVAGFMAVAVVVTSLRSPKRVRTPFSGRSLAYAFPRALPALAIPVILDGGIFSGVFTPQESGAIAVLVGVIAILAMRGISLAQARLALEQAVDGTTLVMFILVCVTVLDYGFTTSGIQDLVNSLLGFATGQPLLYLVVVNLIFLVIHEFVETAPSILVLVPLVMPAALNAGVNPLQLGAVIAVNSTIGLVLPPVGVSLYVVSQIAEVSPLRVLRHLLPYLLASFLALALLTLLPQLSLWLPSVWK